MWEETVVNYTDTTGDYFWMSKIIDLTCGYVSSVDFYVVVGITELRFNPTTV